MDIYLNQCNVSQYMRVSLIAFIVFSMFAKGKIKIDMCQKMRTSEEYTTRKKDGQIRFQYKQAHSITVIEARVTSKDIANQL